MQDQEFQAEKNNFESSANFNAGEDIDATEDQIDAGEFNWKGAYYKDKGTGPKAKVRLRPLERDKQSVLRYFDKAASHELLSRDDEIELAQRREKGDEQAVYKLVVSNLRLVIKFARQFSGRGLDFEDLIQEGNLGLMRAAALYDPSRGTRFSTYASMWIIQNISRAIDNKSKTIRLPLSMQHGLRTVLRKRGIYRRMHGKHPTDEQLSRLTKLPVERIDKVLKFISTPLSLDQNIGLGGEFELGDTLVSSDTDELEEMAERHFAEKEIEKLMSCLSNEEKLVIIHRFGLYDNKVLSYEQLADLLDTTVGSIRNTYRRSLARLRSQHKQLKLKSSRRVKKRGHFAI